MPIRPGSEPAHPNGHGAVLVLLVVLVVCGSVVLAVVATFRVGAYALAAGLVALAVARATLPVRVIGPLAVRSRVVDVLTASTLAVALVVLAQGVPL